MRMARRKSASIHGALHAHGRGLRPIRGLGPGEFEGAAGSPRIPWVAEAQRGAALCVVVSAGCAGDRTPRTAQSGAVQGTRIGTPVMGDPGEWPMPAKDYAGSRYSTLDDITADNAGRLTVAWTFSTGVLKGHEGAPLVIGSTMYIVTPYPNVAYALDLSRPGAPLRWKFRPENDQAAKAEACCDVVNRGAAYADSTVFYNLLDGHTVAVDARTGAQRWRTQVADPSHGETMTMAPLVVHGKVLVGPSGGEMGVRGWIAALDTRTGKEVWRAYNLGPDADVKIGPHFAPFYPSERGADLAATSWPSETWRHGGAATWGWLTYDPELNLLYYGTSNPGPWDGELRLGDNKYSSSIMARDPDTGELRWALQVTPHDVWDYDAVNESIIADLPIGGAMRKVLVHFDRNGFAYTIDRATGQVLVAQSYVPMNWAAGVDLATEAAAREQPARVTRIGKTITDICPSLEGGERIPAARGVFTGDRPVLPFRPTTCAWTSRAGLRRTSPGHRTSERTRPRRVVQVAIAGNSWRGMQRLAGKCGASVSRSRYGAARSPPQGTSCSTGRWTGGSKRLMRVPESRSGSSKSVRVWSAIR